jgi:hypothetical protein
MDVILHLGVHRTGSTTFQSYMRRNTDTLRARQVGFWGPQRTRKGFFAGVLPVPGASTGRDLQDRARGRVQMHLEHSEQQGMQALVVSEENMTGSVRQNLRTKSLYPAVGERMARFGRAFDGRISEVVLNIRSQDMYWASAAAYGVSRGHPLPDKGAIDRLATAPRTWRDVITDISCALPEVPIWVLPFEVFAGRPDDMLRAGTGIDAPLNAQSEWLNRAPDAAALRDVLFDRGVVPHLPVDSRARWQPFDTEQRAALREAYADDLHWLVSGADGMATLTEDPNRRRAGHTLPFQSQNRGHLHDKQERDVAQSG